MTDAAHVRTTLDGRGVLTVLLDRVGKRNALNLAMWTALDTAVDRAARLDVACVVITGAGPSFCAGADLGSFGADQTPGVFAPATRLTASHRVFRKLRRLRTPTIAAVEGAAVGVGWSLALSCDFVVAGEDARFAAPFLERGFVPDGGIGWLLERSVGPRVARRILLVRPTLSAAEAAALSLVDEVVASGEARSAADAMAGRLASGPRETIELASAMLRRGEGASYEDYLELERDAFVLNAATGNPEEGARAFVERRAPRFNRGPTPPAGATAPRPGGSAP